MSSQPDNKVKSFLKQATIITITGLAIMEITHLFSSSPASEATTSSHETYATASSTTHSTTATTMSANTTTGTVSTPANTANTSCNMRVMPQQVATAPILGHNRHPAYLVSIANNVTMLAPSSTAATGLAVAQDYDFVTLKVTNTADNQLVVVPMVQLDTISNVAEIFPDKVATDKHYYVHDFNLQQLKQLTFHSPNNANLTYNLASFAQQLQTLKAFNKTLGFHAGVFVEYLPTGQAADVELNLIKPTLADLQEAGLNTPVYIVTDNYANLVATKAIVTSQHFPYKLIQLITPEFNHKASASTSLLDPSKLKEVVIQADGIAVDGQYLINKAGRQTSVANNKFTQSLEANLKSASKLEFYPYFATNNWSYNPKQIQEYYQLIKQHFNITGIMTPYADINLDTSAK